MAEKKKKELFEVKTENGMVDGKRHVYTGYVNGYNIGSTVANNVSDARKRLAAAARKLIK